MHLETTEHVQFLKASFHVLFFLSAHSSRPYNSLTAPPHPPSPAISTSPTIIVSKGGILVAKDLQIKMLQLLCTTLIGFVHFFVFFSFFTFFCLFSFYALTAISCEKSCKKVNFYKRKKSVYINF